MHYTGRTRLSKDEPRDEGHHTDVAKKYLPTERLGSYNPHLVQMIHDSLGVKIYYASVPSEDVKMYECNGWRVEQDHEENSGRTTDNLGNIVEANDNGAMQSVVEGRYDLLDYYATKALAEVYAYGAKKYSANNWRGIPVESHINHAIEHIIMALHEMRTGVNPMPGEDHLAHALCRIHMAVAIREQGGESKEAMG